MLLVLLGYVALHMEEVPDMPTGLHTDLPLIGRAALVTLVLLAGVCFVCLS